MNEWIDASDEGGLYGGYVRHGEYRTLVPVFILYKTSLAAPRDLCGPSAAVCSDVPGIIDEYMAAPLK